MAGLQPLHEPPLRHAPSPDAYALHKAALEWSLADPIIINSAEDIKSRVNWRERFEPYEHQVQNLITFCRRLPVTLLADDVGLGKTISAGLVLGELMYRRRVSKALVICPKILMPQWEEELYTKFGIEAYYCTGSEVQREIKRDTPVLITTYDTARRHFDALIKASFDMLVLDEAHKLRNLYGTNNAPQIALRIRDALAKRAFKYVVMLTATPLQNRLWDLYSLIDLLTVAKGHRNPLGTPDDFSRRFIADRGEARHIVPGRAEEFRNILRSYMARTRRGDANLLFPERQVRLHRVPPTKGEMNLFSAIARPILRMNKLSQISLAQALMSSPEALLGQLSNMAEKGTVSRSVVEDAKKAAEGIERTAKLQGLETLINELRKKRKDWRLVIFTSRRETQSAIGRFLEKLGVPHGFIRGGQARANQQAIEDLWAEDPQVHVVVSTDAGAEGVNLQVANVLMNYDLPWNPMIVEQRIGRIQRLASEHANVFVVNTVLAGTVEEHVVARLMSKLQLASHAVGDIEALLESAGMEGDDEDEGSFEDQIRQLVLDSLQGKDVEKATRLAEESIARAKSLIEEEEGTLNQVLGKLEGAHKQGPRIPDLERKTPSISCQEFVLQALGAEGGKIRALEDGIYEVSLPGRSPERFTFDERLADMEEGWEEGNRPLIGKTIRFFHPGRPEFERLVQSWSEKCAHHLLDLTRDTEETVKEIAVSWCESVEQGRHLSHEISERLGSFQGKALLRVQASIAHDSYEKLLELELGGRNGDEPIGQDGLHFAREGEVSTRDLGIEFGGLLGKVLEDRDVAQFCRFYEARKEEELSRAADDERKRRKLEEDFSPKVFPTLVGLEGRSYESVALRVRFLVDAQGPYEAILRLIPAARRIQAEPARIRCEVTGLLVPDVCLEKCLVSGRVALRHLMFRSDLSGRHALKEYAKTCSKTNRLLLPDEIATSATSGAEISKDLLKPSPVSGQLAEAESFARCEITGTEVLPSELMTSQISGKMFRVDQKAASEVSGLIGHISEFTRCTVSGVWLAPREAAKCEVTGKTAMPSRLALCAVTGKKVLPAETGTSAASGKVVLKSLLVKSSISGKPLLRNEGVASKGGKICLPAEAIQCALSGEPTYPDEIERCALTGLEVAARHMTKSDRFPPQIATLRDILNGTLKGADRTELWQDIAALAGKTLGPCTVLSAIGAPSGRSLTVCVETRKWLGLKVRYAGFVVTLEGGLKIQGLISCGRRQGEYWKVEDCLPPESRTR